MNILNRNFSKSLKIGKMNSMKDVLYIIHVGAIAFGIIALWILFGDLGDKGGGNFSNKITSFYDPNLSVTSWVDYQKNSYGANAGALEGLSN